MTRVIFRNAVYFSILLCITSDILNTYNCHAHTTSTESSLVVIIGAGAAGIAAATRLMERGVRNITILEAESRMGGRVYSLPFEHSVLDMGAQWVHGEKDNVVFEMTEKLDLLQSSKVHEEPFYLLSSGHELDPEHSNIMMGAMMEIHNDSDTELKQFNGSLGEYYTQRFVEKLMEKNFSHENSKFFLRWYEKFKNSADGSDSWFETSGRGEVEYWECEGNQAISWKFGGYSNVFNLLMQYHICVERWFEASPASGNYTREREGEARQNKYTSSKLPIFADKLVQYNKEVTQIIWENDNSSTTTPTVLCSDGSSYQAPHVIVTVSLGVLKEKAQTMFRPALPTAKLRAIEGLSIGTVNKIYLKFAYRWWPNDRNGFSLLWTDEDVSSFEPPINTGEHVNGTHWLQELFGFYVVDNHPLVLCGWIVGPTSRYMESLGDEEIIAGTVYLLEKFAGRALGISIPLPDSIIRTSWYSNPHFRGSYSYRSMTTESMETSAHHLAEPIIDMNGIPMLQFAGEATNDHHYSTVNGAVESGWREASRILEYYGSFCMKMVHNV